MVFDEQRPDDLVTEMHGVSVLVDPVSAGAHPGRGGGFQRQPEPGRVQDHQSERAAELTVAANLSRPDGAQASQA